MNNVITISGKPLDELVSDVLDKEERESMERLLAQVDLLRNEINSGNVRAIAVVTVYEDGAFGSGYTGERHNIIALLGAVELLKSRIVKAHYGT